MKNQASKRSLFDRQMKKDFSDYLITAQEFKIIENTILLWDKFENNKPITNKSEMFANMKNYY